MIKEVQLDGERNGIACLISYLNSGKKRFLGLNQGHKQGEKDFSVRLFSNMEIAKTIISTMNHIEKFVQYYFFIDGKSYSMDQAHKIHRKWMIIDNDNILYITEKKVEKGYKFGYLVFEDGDKNHCDKQYGYQRQKELSKLIYDELKEFVITLNFQDIGVNSVNRFKNNNIVNLRNCTGKLNIYTNQYLMDTNQSRKENGQKVFPFIKGMDKYLTFYIIFSKDITEPIRIDSEECADFVLTQLELVIKDKYPDLNIHSKFIEYNGYVAF